MSNKVIFLFHHDKADPISNGMAWATRADVTHVAMLDPKSGTRVIEASGVGEPKGVRIVPLDEWVARHPGYTRRYVVDPDPQQIWDLCASREGAGYDWLYLVGWWLRLMLEDPKKFTCQELFSWAFQQAGRPLFDTRKPHFLTPQNFYNISKRLE